VLVPQFVRQDWRIEEVRPREEYAEQSKKNEGKGDHATSKSVRRLS
jgi:hypothetical protein